MLVFGRKPLPILRKFSGRLPTVAPSSTTVVRPRKISIEASVTMKAGMPT